MNKSSDNILIISQGSQAIQLIRQIFSLKFKPEKLIVLTTSQNKNRCFEEFLKYYRISFEQIDKKVFNNILSKYLDSHKIKFVISFSNPFIINKHNLTKCKFLNFHPGILPKYKGSLSTVWSMIMNEDYVGGTWHYISEKVDCGPIIKSFKIKICENSTSFSLNHKIFFEATNCLEEVLNLVNSGFQGFKQKKEGKFYLNKFPDINKFKLDDSLRKRINYFPPNFKN